jgi:hypothetical protein
MIESSESRSEQFRFPDINAEQGEFERTGKAYGLDHIELMRQAETMGRLMELSEEVWSRLGNTDSFDIGESGWNTVRQHSDSQEVKRDWESLKNLLVRGDAVDAPIIMKRRGEYHLVSGNTRLMVARALGMRPHVLLFEIHED